MLLGLFVTPNSLHPRTYYGTTGPHHSWIGARYSVFHKCPGQLVAGRQRGHILLKVQTGSRGNVQRLTQARIL